MSAAIKKKRAAVIGETQTEAAVTDAELELFGEDESVSSEEETTSAIMFEIDEKNEKCADCHRRQQKR